MFPPQAVEEEDKMTPEQLAIKNVGKQVKIVVFFKICVLIYLFIYVFSIKKIATSRSVFVIGFGWVNERERVHWIRVRWCRHI